MCCDLDLLLGTSQRVHTPNKTSLYLFPLSSVTLVSEAGGAAGGGIGEEGNKKSSHISNKKA